MHRDAHHQLVDLSQEGARAAVPSAPSAYPLGRRYAVVLHLVSRTVLVTEAEVIRVTPGEAAFRFHGLHFPFSIILDEHCAVTHEDTHFPFSLMLEEQRPMLGGEAIGRVERSA